jgi:hypothetical protein
MGVCCESWKGVELTFLRKRLKCLEPQQRGGHGPQTGRIAIQGGGGGGDVALGINIAAAERHVGVNEYINRDAEDEIRESLRPVLHLNGCWNKLCLKNLTTYTSFST